MNAQFEWLPDEEGIETPWPRYFEYGMGSYLVFCFSLCDCSAHSEIVQPKMIVYGDGGGDVKVASRGLA